MKNVVFLVMAAISTIAAHAHAQPGAALAPPADEPGPPVTVPPAPSPPPGELDTLTRTARSVARDGRCDALPVLGKRVRDLDEAYYQRVFARDPVIAGCRTIDPSVARRALPTSQAAEEPPARTPIFQSSGEDGKDGSTAFWASALTTFGGVGLAVFASSQNVGALGDVAGLMMLVGPTVGHTYAGQTWNTGLGIRLAGITVAVVGGGLAARCLDGCTASSDNSAGVGLALLLGGSVTYLIGSLYEIATASEAAHEYNREHGIEPRLTFAPMQARGGTSPGLALIGRF